jgi:hypothetical protein
MADPKKQILILLQRDVASYVLSHNVYSFTSQAQELHGATPSPPQGPPQSVRYFSSICSACIGTLMGAALVIASEFTVRERRE